MPFSLNVHISLSFKTVIDIQSQTPAFISHLFFQNVGFNVEL